MKISRSGGVYVGKCHPRDRAKFKHAGFVYDDDDGFWKTEDDNVALNLYDYTIKSARKRLDEYKSFDKTLTEESYATEAEAIYPCPEGLAYLPYQNGGIRYALPRKVTLIADQPGLGKTIQAIGVSNAITKLRRILIVVPASLKVNWMREFMRWDVKGLSVGITASKTVRTRIEGSSPARYKTSTEHVWPDTDVVIINYEMVKNFDQTKEFEWDYIICDESHMLNNLKADRTRQVYGHRAIKPLRAKKWVFLTGTPILNKPAELWPLLKFADPNGLGRSWKRYVYRYCAAQETPWGLDTSGACNLEELNFLLRRTLMVRRLKTDVLKDLPPKVRNPVFLPEEGLKKVVKKEYECFLDNLARLEAYNEERDYTPEELKEASEEEIKEIMKDIFDRGVLSNWEQTLAFKEEAEKQHFEAMSILREDVALSKVAMAKSYVENLVASGEKVIVFVVHKSVAKAMKEHFPNAAMVVGGMSAEAKQAEVDRFQNDPECTEFIGNIDAAGVGYTLTAASHVVKVELCWVPAKAEQAEDRAHRISQKDTVIVHYLIVNGSIECLMLDALLAKQDMIAQALD